MIFRMKFPAKAGPRPCQVEGCSGQEATRTAMWVQFCHRNVRDTVVILEEGNPSHPWCPLCNMMVPWWYLNGLNHHTDQWKKGAERNLRCLAEEEERAVPSREFRSYGRPIEMVTSFRYLGRVILAADNDWPALVQNLAKARAVWRMKKRILSREGEEPRVSEFFFKVVVQSVLLLNMETRVVTPCTGQVLGGFQDQLAQRLTGRILQGKADGKWEYT